ncbi:hypothetical protein [Nocardioides jishulii]|uniref:Uncharacterized protein n=1 Tax=Nocardioides jishulii TaxID=2575440 RepID=A0A4U2YSZ8_9ACTN|nr:hypothetical protein [Nocardioides jishulii]QCX28813.1 hypothetical protein FCL41_15710 [Nocardioides jishulii]TKI64290.1 hypothetical protein FC770_03855 [Nocardioides jishulii]
MTNGGSSRLRGAIRTLVVAVGTLVAGWVMLPGFIVLLLTAPGYGSGTTFGVLGGSGTTVTILGLYVIGVPVAALALTLWLKRPVTGLVGFLVGVGASVFMLGLF